MANQRNIIVERDKARRYAKLSAEYASWTPRVKRLVEEANSEDWGTFVVACALLESVVPRAEIDKIERQIEYDRRYAEHAERAEKRDHSLRFACITASVITTAIVYALLYVASASQVFSFTNVKHIAELETAFTIPGLIAFSVLGSFSAGFALGSYSDRRKRASNLAMILSCIAGILCAFLCTLIPPVSLILAWTAWRSSDAMKPQVISVLQKQADYKEVHGKRVYARDSRAPWFVKNAIRLAGIYQGSTGSIGNISREALSRNQSDYGAFVIYEAILTEHHAQRRAEESIRKVDEMANKSNGYDEDNSPSAADELREAARSDEQTERTSTIMRGVITSVVVAMMIWFAANTSDMFASLFDPLRTYALNTAFAVLGLISILVGWRSTVRVASIYGISAEEKRMASVLRPAWFAAWVMVLGVLLLFIVTTGIAPSA